MASLEEILAYKAAETAESFSNAPSIGTGVGASTGALLGFMAGVPLQRARNSREAITDNLAVKQGAAAPRQPMKALRPGPRMAGGLLGMMLGGGLGRTIAAQATKDNPAAELLAKLQITGQLNTDEAAALQEMVSQYYGSVV